MSGLDIGRWTVLEQSGNAPKGGALWRCRCSCGNTRDVLGSDLRQGKSTSCGCASSRATMGERSRTHGMTGTRLYSCWKNMRRRCNSPKSSGFKNYGGRGISVCSEWSDFLTFSNWAIKNGYRDDLTLERDDCDGDYCPANCSWVTRQRQSENRRFVAKNSEGKLWWHIAKENGITQAAYRTRLYDGWAYEDAATRPLGTREFERARDAKGRFSVSA